MSNLLTIPELAAELRCSEAGAYSVAKDIGFKVGAKGGLWRVERADLEAWKKRRQVASACRGKGELIPQPVVPVPPKRKPLSKRRLAQLQPSLASVSHLPPIKPIQPRLKRNLPEGPGVYVMQLGETVKIGKSVNIARRLYNIQTSTPSTVKLIAVLSRDPNDERVFHELFAASRIRGEWFRYSEEIQSYLRGLGNE